MAERVQGHVARQNAGPHHGPLEDMRDAVDRVGLMRPRVGENPGRPSFRTLIEHGFHRWADRETTDSPVLGFPKHELRNGDVFPFQGQQLPHSGARDQRQTNEPCELLRACLEQRRPFGFREDPRAAVIQL
jgi:hypothetical protein